MSAEPAFVGAGRKPGLEAWRIEDLAPVKLAQVDGKLYTGDSYIFLSTTNKGSLLVHNIHFWLGAETTLDESGVAAYKSVELDDALEGAPVQYREIQGHESPLFLSYFKETGLTYLQGGVASGFQHVERDVYPTRLLHLKGARVVRAKEVPVSSSSLNTNDVFILDKGLKIFMWYGPDANRREKAKGLEVVHTLDDERGARAEVILVNEDPHNQEFWSSLGGEVAITDAGQDDAKAEAEVAGQVTLNRVSTSDGTLTVTPVPPINGKYLKSQLHSTDTLVLDGITSIFIWLRKDATAEDRREGMVTATKFLQQSGRPAHTPIVRVTEGSETAAFKSYFNMWEPAKPVDFSQTQSTGIALSPKAEFNLKTMLERVKHEEATIDDDGSGKVTVWRVENMDTVPVPQEQYGQFYSGDSYVILYTYKKNGRDHHIIYFWQGHHTSTDEKAISALVAVKLDTEMGGSPVQVRVVQGKEPAHFRDIFKGKMVIRTGGKASGFKNRDDEDTIVEGPELFHVKGTTSNNTYAIQVPTSATSLNSGDCFVLSLKETQVYVWTGSYSSDSEKTSAIESARVIGAGREPLAVNEGSEPEEFWSLLGGKADYPTVKSSGVIPQEPRLFQISNATGSPRVDEIFNFSQSDLVDDDVMILDTFTTVFVWVGSHSNDVEKRTALQAAGDYIKQAKDGRDPGTPIVRVEAGHEPVFFTQHFHGWDPTLAQANIFLDPYEAKLQTLKEKKAEQQANTVDKDVVSLPPPPPASSSRSDDDANVDPTKREALLSDEEFEKLFGMTKAQFYAMPLWKQQAQKKQHGLF